MREDCSIIILAGGKSSRMGTPKAWLDFDGRPLLAWLVERMQRHFPEVVIVSAPGQDLPETSARVVYDEQPGEGPVAGLVVGLREVTRPLAFATSCDVPFLRPDLIDYLVEVLNPHDVAVPEWEGRLHPLQAVYRTTVQPLLTAQLAAGQRRPVALFERVPTRIVREDELRRIDPEGLSFLNMNTPEDYQRALDLWTRQLLR